MICPARVSTDYYRSGYGYYSGGATNLRLKLSQLHNWAQVQRTFGRGLIPGGTPAIWGCRVVANSGYSSATGGVAETGGHWNSTKNRPAGGNVGHADGSVVWYPYNPSGDWTTPSSYVLMGAVNSGSVGWPSDCICPYTQYDGSVVMTAGSISFEMGGTWGSACNFPQ
jgi:hypothetical protein